MENVHFTDVSIAALTTQSLLFIIIPIVIFIIWKIKTKEKVLPAIIGAAVFFIFAILLKSLPAYFLIQDSNPLAESIRGNIWLAYITVGLLAGLFEETGRFLAFKTVLRKYTERRNSITYGIGHGGFESIYIGIQTFSIAILGIIINSGQIDAIIGTMDSQTQSLLASQLAPLSATTFVECFLGVAERLSAITIHISLSVMVFAAARNKKRLFLYPVAILLHSLLDFMIVFYASGITNIYLTEIILAVFALSVALFASRIYAKMKKQEII